MVPWDVIVIGAGLGGLSAAARLIQEGRRVLVLEKTPHPGGTAYVYVRNGFTFPMGPMGFSSPQALGRLFETVDVDQGFSLSRVHYLIKAFGMTLPISLSFDHLKRKIAEIFPEEQMGIDRFFQDIKDLIRAMKTADTGASGMTDKAERPLSAERYLDTIIGDWRLRRILGSQGTRKAYSSLPLLSAMWHLMGNLGIWYPKGGMRRLCERCARAVALSPRGAIRFGTTVRKIRIRNRRVSGVTLEDQTRIDACHVISNADFKTTFLRLIEPDALTENHYRAVTSARQSSSILQVCLGLEAKQVDLSLFDSAGRIIYRRESAGEETAWPEVDWNAGEIESDTLAGQEIEIALWSREDASLAPDGGAVVIIRVEADHAHFSRYRPAPRRRTASYFPYKMRLGHGLVCEAAKIIPGLMNAVRVMDVATPLTFEDQGGRSEGAVAGWSWNFEDHPHDRVLDFIQTPLRGLYMAGYQACSALFMGGIPTAVESGYKAARAVMTAAGPITEMNLPGKQPGDNNFME